MNRRNESEYIDWLTMCIWWILKSIAVMWFHLHTDTLHRIDMNRLHHGQGTVFMRLLSSFHGGAEYPSWPVNAWLWVLPWRNARMLVACCDGSTAQYTILPDYNLQEEATCAHWLPDSNFRHAGGNANRDPNRCQRIPQSHEISASKQAVGIALCQDVSSQCDNSSGEEDMQKEVAQSFHKNDFN